MPSRSPKGARPEALFKPPPERQPLAARMRPRNLEEFVGVLEPFGGGYKVERSDHSFAALLATLGKEGWELIAAVQAPKVSEVSYYFERPR
jgi:hypothetical protein